MDDVWVTTVDECLQELMETAVEQTIEEIREKRLEFVAEQVIEKVIELLVAEILEEISPKSIPVHEYKRLIQMLKDEVSALMLQLPSHKTSSNEFNREKLAETVELINDLEVARAKAIHKHYRGHPTKN